jgi:hypothetical protein
MVGDHHQQPQISGQAEEQRLPLAASKEEEQIQDFWGQGRCPQDAYGASPGHVCGDEHLYAGCAVGDPVTPRPAQGLRCDH